MSGPKKHPLEVFRANAHRLGPVDRPSRLPLETEPVASDESMDVTSERPPFDAPTGDFELRLKLPGVVMLLFAFVVLMAIAHVYGYRRGESFFREISDAAALERGRLIENTTPSSRGGVSSTDSRWYGVLAITYNVGQEALLDGTIEILRSRYGFEDIVSWEYASDRKLELFVGASRDRNDPKLKLIEQRLHLIDNFPNTSKNPFATALIKRHPGIPSTDGTDDEEAR